MWPRHKCRDAAQKALFMKSWQPLRHKVHAGHFNNLNGPSTNQVSLAPCNAVLLADNLHCTSTDVAFEPISHNIKPLTGKRNKIDFLIIMAPNKG